MFFEAFFNFVLMYQISLKIHLSVILLQQIPWLIIIQPSSIQAHLRSQRQLLSEYATSFRAQEEVQGRRRDAAEVGIFCIFLLGEFWGWYKGVMYQGETTN